MPNFKGTRFTNAHETLIWASKSENSQVQVQLSRHEGDERGTADAVGLADPDLHRRRTVEDRWRQGAPDAKARGAAVSHPARLHRARRSDRRSVLRHRHHRRGGASCSAAISSASSARRNMSAVAEKRIASLLPLSGGDMTVTQGKRGETRIPFGSLVESGLVRPGTRLIDPQRRHHAEVRADGSLSMGSKTGSIHQLGRRSTGPAELQRLDLLAHRGSRQAGAARQQAQSLPGECRRGVRSQREAPSSRFQRPY